MRPKLGGVMGVWLFWRNGLLRMMSGLLRQENLEEIAGQAGNDGEGKNWMGMEFWPVGCGFRRNVVKV